MKITSLVSLLLAGLLAAVVVARDGPMGKPAIGLAEVPQSPPGKSFWPQPQEIILSDDLLSIDIVNFQITTNLKKCPVLTRAIARYDRRFFEARCLPLEKFRKQRPVRPPPNLGPDDQPIVKLRILVTRSECEQHPPAEASEFYTLSVNPDPTQPNTNMITIQAYTAWGALRGMETLSQAIFQDKDGVWSLYRLTVLDYPRFTHRGVLLDTSRHFVPLNEILATLDAMEMNKMNVFHWHIVDDISFPYVSPTFPELSNKGAFDNETHVYLPSDVHHVIDYAAERGIRVIPEFDTPGHTLAWGPGQPGLLTPCYKDGKPDGTYGPINPMLPSSYAFLQKFMSEITTVFKDSYFHVGGDEVDFNCWKSNPNITDFMKKQGFGNDYAKLESFYINKLLGLMRDLKRNTVVWQEVFDNGVTLGNDTIVHVWIGNGDTDEMANATSAGHRVIFSSKWYLNYIGYGKDWPKYYTADPQDFPGSDKQKNLVLGGEACMWGEFVDGSNVVSRTWPRASAVAERLWSDASVKNESQATPRLETHRCRMLKNGLRVDPVNGPGFCPCDYVF